MCTLYYVPAACREQCTVSSPSPLRVIRKYSFKNLRAYKNHPRHTNLFAKSTKSCHASSSFASSGAILARSAPPMVHSCISNMSSPSAVVFASVLGVSHDSTLYSSGYPATGFRSVILADERPGVQKAISTELQLLLDSSAVYYTRIYTTDKGTACFLYVFQVLYPLCPARY